MATEKYGYLKKYINSKKGGYHNNFYKLDISSIKKVENKLHIIFPSQLVDFYKEIGYGFLTMPHEAPDNYVFSCTNRINSPRMIEDMLINGESSGLIDEMTLELLEPGDIPFFEIGDSSSFLIMKTKSENPNAVWSDCGVKIEDSFEKFIWNLYYEDPAYYGDIIQAHYAKKK